MPRHLRVCLSSFPEVLNPVVILDFNGDWWCSGLLEIRSLLYLGPGHGWKSLISTAVLSVERLSHGQVGSSFQVSPLPSSRVKWGVWGGRFLYIKGNVAFSVGDCGLTHIPVVTNCKFLNSHPSFHFEMWSQAGIVTLI